MKTIFIICAICTALSFGLAVLASFATYMSTTGTAGADSARACWIAFFCLVIMSLILFFFGGWR